MTVKELKEALSKYPDDMDIVSPCREYEEFEDYERIFGKEFFKEDKE